MSATAEIIPFDSARGRGGRSRSMASRPEAFVELPSDNRALVRECLKIIETCRNDSAARAAYYRSLNQVIETGRSDGSRSLLNLLYRMVDRLSSLLFSPTEIRFAMDFENEYGDEILQRGGVAARLLGRSWERSNTDILFAQGVFESLKYGATILKQQVKQEGSDRLPTYSSGLIMPWQFGVYKPSNASLDAQAAMVETIYLTMPEVWRRVWHMPDARQLFDRIMQHAAPGTSSDINNSFFHQILSTSQIQTGVGGPTRPTVGGIVQLNQDPTFGGIGPSDSALGVLMHELWMWGEHDYTTIQIIEPDILIAPRYKASNLLIPGGESGLHPYTLIQPNQTHGSIWGRSEIQDLIAPQDFLSTTAADIRRLFGLQVDKFLALTGDGITDEQYDAMRQAGYMNLGPGGSVNDLTPKFPGEALPLVDKIIQLMEMISGFDNMLSGRGETGVRSGVQSNPMMKTAGAPIGDRALITERQCAQAADLLFHVMAAKDGRNFWTDRKKPAETAFLLADIPDDGRVVVDGHTTSPIFANDHLNLLTNGLKVGVVDAESYIEQAPFQNRDIILTRLRAKEEKQAALLDQLKHTNPEAYAKLLEHSGGRRR
jgi:hypothetical protein